MSEENHPQKWKFTESQNILLDVVLARQQKEVLDLLTLYARELQVAPDVENTPENIIKNRAFVKEAKDEESPVPAGAVL